eukprot:TRINITY_DN6845_c0_g1_i2.p1 TRINITY_DN6845_c0_g1~~TRINITY_DN6845_c0_g1_i2.p1  ORF type:complete len:198 (+),score=32.71 TRINITY_DN6845_c0_g1_i2:60-653(+)
MCIRDSHPDINKAGAEKFKEINEAYEVLGDEKNRKKYDEFRKYQSSSSAYSQQNDYQSRYGNQQQQYQQQQQQQQYYQQQYTWSSSDWRRNNAYSNFYNQGQSRYQSDHYDARESDDPFHERLRRSRERMRVYQEFWKAQKDDQTRGRGYDHEYSERMREHFENWRRQQEEMMRNPYQNPYTNPCLLYTSPSPRDQA